MYYRDILLFILIVVCSCKGPAIKETGVIPQPKSSIKHSCSFKFSDGDGIYFPKSGLLGKSCKRFAEFMSHNFDISFNSTDKRKSIIKFIESDTIVPDGAYNIEILKKEIKIYAASDAGFVYAFETLKQMLSPANMVEDAVLKCGFITDAPKFQWRGMMLDVSRHFMTKDSVKKILDLMVMHKLNKFHWHLTDGIGWRIQIDKYPELTRKGAWRKVQPGVNVWEKFEACTKDQYKDVYGGYYTKDDIREIVKYAKERAIDVIPEIEMPGHSEAALQCYPELVCKGRKNNGSYCAGNEKTFEFLRNIIDEVVELFPYEYIHIGGDEVNKNNWKNCPLCNKVKKTKGLHDFDELQSYFVKRMESYIASKDRMLIGWDEILEGGLPERATVMSWRGVKGGIEAANAGHDVVMSPGQPCYFDHSQGNNPHEPESWGGYNSLSDVYDFNPVPEKIDESKREHILGGQANLWTERIPNQKHAEYMLLPRLCALSEALWRGNTKPGFENFKQRLNNHLHRLSDLGYNYSESSMTPDLNVQYNSATNKFVLKISNEIGMYNIRFTTDGTTPDTNSQLYSTTVEFNQPITVKAQCFRDGLPVGYLIEQDYSASSSEKVSVTYHTPFNKTYSGGGAKALFDNKYALPRGDDKRWQGFKKRDFDITVDLGEKREISEVSMNFFQSVAASSVMLPTSIHIKVSEDGKNYKTVKSENIETQNIRKAFIKTIKTQFDSQKVRYIKIKAPNRGTLPTWHVRKGSAWVFVDEVVVK